ncbi:MAG: hypothetical protein U0Q03_24720 [Acidimicrobiales bacterium]
MGFFRDLRDVTKRARAINETWDAGAQASDGLQRMRDANRMMASMAAGTTSSMHAAINGRWTTATIAVVWSTGSTVNFAPVMEFELDVATAGQQPVRVRCTEVVPSFALARTAIGSVLNVRYDDASGQVFIDWTSPVDR